MVKLSMLMSVSVACAQETDELGEGRFLTELAYVDFSKGSGKTPAGFGTTDSAEKISKAQKQSDRQDKCWQDHGSKCCTTPRPAEPPPDGTELYICNECCCDVEDLIKASGVSRDDITNITFTPVIPDSSKPSTEEASKAGGAESTPVIIIDTIQYCPIPNESISGDNAFGVCMSYQTYAEAQTDCFVAEFSTVEVTTQANETSNIGDINHVPDANRDDPDPSHDSSLGQCWEKHGYNCCIMPRTTGAPKAICDACCCALEDYIDDNLEYTLGDITNISFTPKSSQDVGTTITVDENGPEIAITVLPPCKHSVSGANARAVCDAYDNYRNDLEDGSFCFVPDKYDDEKWDVGITYCDESDDENGVNTATRVGVSHCNGTLVEDSAYRFATEDDNSLQPTSSVEENDRLHLPEITV